MKTSTPSQSFSFAKIFCSLFGHNYFLSKSITDHVKEYTCSHCGEQATTNSKGCLEAMTPVLKEINEDLAIVHAKKMARKNEIKTYQVAS
ncbi:hypothetical protein ACE939_13370 [Aquimarina sp. W85]|uniref:hypothetical protein n=1 Tax=Aquimarina rhodophyticola TaxID=3342246 RepID=UPI00366AD436